MVAVIVKHSGTLPVSQWISRKVFGLILPNRFLASKSESEQKWLDARRGGVTATTVAKAASGVAGFAGELEKLRNPSPIEDNAYMKFGRDAEPWIMDDLETRFGIIASDWVIASKDNPRFLATPDGLSADHTRSGEVKTTGTDWGEWSKVPIHYRRQCQWQMFVCDTEETVFAYMLRDNDFTAAWLEVKTFVIPRDEKMISQLVRVADDLLLSLDAA